MLTNIIQNKKEENDKLFNLNNANNLKFITKYLTLTMEIMELSEATNEISKDILWYMRDNHSQNPNANSHGEYLKQKYNGAIIGSMIQGLENLQKDIYSEIRSKITTSIFIYNMHFEINTSHRGQHENNIIKYINLCIENKINIDNVDFKKILKNYVFGA